MCFQSFALFLLYHVVLSSWWWWWFPAITLSQPNYSYGCFVIGVVVVVGLWQYFLTMRNFTKWRIFIENIKFCHNDEFSSFWSVFFKMMKFHHDDKFQSSQSDFIKMMKFHHNDESLSRWQIHNKMMNFQYSSSMS